MDEYVREGGREDGREARLFSPAKKYNRGERRGGEG
jgi:hypothetical protein